MLFPVVFFDFLSASPQFLDEIASGFSDSGNPEDWSLYSDNPVDLDFYDYTVPSSSFELASLPPPPSVLLWGDTLFPGDDTLFPEDDTLFPEDDTLFSEDDTLFPEDDTLFPKDDMLFSKDELLPTESAAVDDCSSEGVWRRDIFRTRQVCLENPTDPEKQKLRENQNFPENLGIFDSYYEPSYGEMDETACPQIKYGAKIYSVCDSGNQEHRLRLSPYDYATLQFCKPCR
jgi:hypothetical protein